MYTIGVHILPPIIILMICFAIVHLVINMYNVIQYVGYDLIVIVSDLPPGSWQF